MNDLFVTRENKCNLRNCSALESSLKRTVTFAKETISHSVVQIWNLIPERLRTFSTFCKFTKEIKKMEIKIADVECAKYRFNMFALLTNNVNVFFCQILLL